MAARLWRAVVRKAIEDRLSPDSCGEDDLASATRFLFHQGLYETAARIGVSAETVRKRVRHVEACMMETGADSISGMSREDKDRIIDYAMGDVSPVRINAEGDDYAERPKRDRGTLEGEQGERPGIQGQRERAENSGLDQQVKA
ncbi:MAG: hypothetical protein ACRD3D_01165 [Terriglobia bacterium]